MFCSAADMGNASARQLADLGSAMADAADRSLSRIRNGDPMVITRIRVVAGHLAGVDPAQAPAHDADLLTVPTVKVGEAAGDAVDRLVGRAYGTSEAPAVHPVALRA